MASQNIKVKIEKAKGDKNWKFTIKGKNGLVLTSARNYNRHESALKTVNMMVREMAKAQVEIIKVAPAKKLVRKKK